MKARIYINIFIIFLCLVFLPDFILSLGGRDTYIFYRYPFSIDIGKIVLLAGFVLIVIESLELAIKKKWVKIACVWAGLFIFLLLCRISISVLVEKSVSEARREVEVFLSSKGVSDNLIFSAEDDVRQSYINYLTEKFSKEDLQLMWASPRYGKYEFRIYSKNHSPFLVRLSTSQIKPNQIWVHKIEQPAR